MDSHASVLHALNADEALIAAISNKSMQQLDDKTRSLFKYVEKLTLNPGDITEEDTENLRVAGWSDQAIEDTIGIVATFAFLNRLVDGIGIEGSDEHYKQVGGMVAQHGYLPTVKMIEQKLAR